MMNTYEAAVKFNPTPPALREIRKIGFFQIGKAPLVLVFY